MPRELPDYLYKYRSTNLEFLERIIVGNHIFFSTPSQFNDPFDCFVKFDNSGTPQEWNKKFKELIKRNMPELNKKKRKAMAAKWVLEGKHKKFDDFSDDSLITEMGVFSLGEEPDNILMWSHYAENHKGLCLQFKASPSCFLMGRALPVDYDDEYPQRSYLRDSLEDSVIKFFTTKFTHWKYEKEWRIFAHPNSPFNAPGEHPFPPALLTGIIFGCHAENAFIDEVIAMTKHRKDELRVMHSRMVDRKYALNIS